LLEVGLRTTASARRANDVVAGEIDQGQHDDRSDVLAVGTAGALIDRAVWEELDGTSPEFPVFNDGLELSRAVRLAGHRVVVVPQAVIRHRRASYLGLRPSQGGAPERPAADADPLPSAPWARAADPDPDRSFRARRIAQLTAWATFSGRPIGLLLIWFLILGIARSGVRLLTKSPALARAELGAALTVLRRGGAIRRGRRRLASHATVRRSVLTRLYVHAADIRSVRRDRRRQERERAVRAAAPSELELRELAVLARRRRLSLTGVLLAVVVVAGAGLSPLLVTGSITGGASVGLATTGRALWGAAWATWAASGDGYTAVANPLLALLALPVAVASRFGLDGDGLIRLLILAAVPLAALGAWFAAGTITRRVGLRAWAALTWALAPALLLAVGQGRLTAVLVHLALPWALLALARAVGADRRDAVLSGLVDAHHATEREKADLDRFASERVEDLAALADDSDDAAQSDGTGLDNEVAEADEGADEGDGPASSTTDAAATAAIAVTRDAADSAAPRERAVAL
ncbi:MAG: glycosyltransferase, partial [Actinomyces dentalis]